MAKHPEKQRVSTTKPTKPHAYSSLEQKSEEEEDTSSDSSFHERESKEEEGTSSDSSSSDPSSDASETPSSKKPRTTKSVSVGDSSKKATVFVSAAKEGVENTNKKLFQRVFTEKDEIILLEGLFDYLKESGVHDNDAIDMVGFHEYIKESIHTQITKAQLSDKVKRFKRRFKNNQNRVFKQDSHEKKVFELCSKIWCIKDSAGKSVPTINPSSMPHSPGKPGFNLFDAGYEDDLAMFGLGVADILGVSEIGADLKKKLMQLKVADCQLIIRQNLLKIEKIKLIMECLKSEAN